MVPTVMAQVCKEAAAVSVHRRPGNLGCAAAQESMRLRPVVAGGMLRVVARDVRLSNGLVLPRGATITGSNLAVLNNPHSWEAPERFIPVRLHACPFCRSVGGDKNAAACQNGCAYEVKSATHCWCAHEQYEGSPVMLTWQGPAH